MKLVLAYVQPHKVSEVSLALHHVAGLTGLSVCDVDGWGRGKRSADHQHHADQVRDFEPHRRLEVVCLDELVEGVVRAIQEAAHTGLPGDGTIFVLPVEQAVRISRGDRGEAAV
jgi:nitrogen regulatory protein PII